MHEHVRGIDLRMFILDVLRYDIEPLESIVKLLNDNSCIGWRTFWPRDFTVEDVIEVLAGLIADKYVDVYELSPGGRELTPLDMNFLNLERNAATYWYLLTNKGREVWDAWEPPNEPEGENGN